MVALAGFAAGAAPAHGYVLKPYSWDKHRVTYYNAATRYSHEVRAAARAWNHSGVRFRWVPGTRRGADVTVRVGRLPRGVAGATRSVWGARTNHLVHATIFLPPDNLRSLRSRRESRYYATLAIVHEFGHAMGLGHETSRCATMNPSFPLLCPTPAQRWRFHCRLLQADDVAGVIRRYGGRSRALGPAVCDRSPRPRPPSGLAVKRDGAGRPLVSWQDPGGAHLWHLLLRRRDGCPRGAKDPDATLVAGGPARGGAQAIVDENALGPGHYCYAVVIVDWFDHPSTVATVEFDQSAPPVAGFSWAADPGDAHRIVFTDRSSDPDGTIVAWRWDFGDGTTSTESNPSHLYATGSYPVTLRVTDDQGLTSVMTQRVTTGTGG